MAYPLARMETTQEFGSGATDGVRAKSDPASGMGYYVWLYGNYQPFGHAGKDLKAAIGTPIYAIDDGTVLYAGWAEDLPGSGPIRKWLFYYNFGGILTVIQHSWGISAIAHQSSNDEVTVGQRVKAGQLIGKSGNTKTRTTTVEPHVHIEALVYMDYRTDVSNGIVYGRVDPTPYFGGIAAMGESITPIEQEWSDMATREEVKQAAYEGCLDALNWAIDTDDGKKLSVFGMVGAVLPRLNRLPKDVVNEPFPWYGFDGKRPANGRTTTTLAINGGFADAIATAISQAKAPQVDVQALAAALAPHLTTAQAKEFLVALGNALPKE